MSKAQLTEKITRIIEVLPEKKLEHFLKLLENEMEAEKGFDQKLVSEIFQKYDNLMKRLA
jgi:hypothetical protein